MCWALWIANLQTQTIRSNKWCIRTCHTHPTLTAPTPAFTQTPQSAPPYPISQSHSYSHLPFPLHCSSKGVTRKQSEWLFESSCIASKTLADDAFEQTSTIFFPQSYTFHEALSCFLHMTSKNTLNNHGQSVQPCFNSWSTLSSKYFSPIFTLALHSMYRDCTALTRPSSTCTQLPPIHSSIRFSQINEKPFVSRLLSPLLASK